MKEEALRTEEDKQLLMHWATACKTLTARMLGGLDALFIAATQGTNTALPAAMITDSEVHLRYISVTSPLHAVALCLLISLAAFMFASLGCGECWKRLLPGFVTSWAVGVGWAQILVDLVYELGANADMEQRSLISRQLATSALRNGNQDVQAQVSQLLLSLNVSLDSLAPA
jgi:hypothetical protein